MALHPSFSMKNILLAALTLCLSTAALALEVNDANEAELDSIKGLGPSSTARILKERQKGAFKDWADFLTRVKGFKTSGADKLSRNGLTVNGAAYEPVQAPLPAVAASTPVPAK